MTYAFYHWWSYPGEPPPYQNLRTPIIASLATLRGVSDVPIVVHDISDQQVDWGHFPEKLNFKVRRLKGSLRNNHGDIEGWRHLSRLFDLNAHAEMENLISQVMYVDCDVFWLRDPFPLATNSGKFCFDGWNSGFFYYYPQECELFFDIFKAYTMSAIYSEDVRAMLRSYIGYDAWYGVWDEMTLSYMTKKHPHLFERIPVEEHATLKNISSANPDKIKMFHSNGTMMQNEFKQIGGQKDHSRGLLCLVVKEFYDTIRKVLSEDDLVMMYGEQAIEHYLPKQFSLLDNIGRLVQLRDRSGHFHIKRMFEKVPTML